MTAPAAQAATRAAGILASRFTPERVRAHLVAGESWRPFPTVEDRSGWEALDAALRAEILARAEARIGFAWPALPASVFLEFARNGNRSRYEVPHFERRGALIELVVGECVENKGRFLDDIVNGVWALCEESFWGVSAHSSSRRFERGLPDTTFHVVDLFAAETGALLAWTHYLLRSAIGRELPVVLDRIEREVRDRILDPYRSIDDWPWLGFTQRPDGRPPNNWNPWIHSNILAANLLLEPDAEVRAATVDRSLTGIDLFLAGYHSDGGCDEGISYWSRAGGSLFDCLWALDSASGGKLDGFDIPLVQEIGRYVYRAHIGGPWYVNFADGAAKPKPDAPLVYRYGRRIGDDRLQAQAAEAAREPTGFGTRGQSIARVLGGLFEPMPPEVLARPAPLIREGWLDGIEVLIAREREGDARGLYLAAKGGHNAESHNHNDIGHFIVGVDGAPVLIDVGVETYTRKTFSADRYDIWTMQSSWHNLPTIDGHQQRAGLKYAARDFEAQVTAESAGLSLDIGDAYGAEAGIRTWRRTVRLDRGDPAQVRLRDEWDLESAPSELTLSLMAASGVELVEPGVLRCAGEGRSLLVRFDGAAFRAEIERIAIDDARLLPVWGDHVSRVLLHARAPSAQGSWALTMTAEGG